MDSKIIQKAILGDYESLSLLIDEYKDMAFHLAFSIVKDKDDARDITQDSFLKVLKNIQKFRNEAGFSTWLYRIVYNQSIRHLQKKKRAIPMDTASYSIPDTPDDPGETREKVALMLKAVDELDEQERTIITLFYLAGKSIKEITAITGLRTSNIKVRLHRIRKKLYEKLQQTDDE